MSLVVEPNAINSPAAPVPKLAPPFTVRNPFSVVVFAVKLPAIVTEVPAKAS